MQRFHLILICFSIFLIMLCMCCCCCCCSFCIHSRMFCHLPTIVSCVNQTAFQYLKKLPNIDHSKIILFGRSLGGAVAIAMAAKHSDEVMALFVEVGHGYSLGIWIEFDLCHHDRNHQISSPLSAGLSMIGLLALEFIHVYF